jgi:2-polyprenyl-3-methyl-5-hydroxy-6-metoxy-1,4-benzoquinol methylase
MPTQAPIRGRIACVSLILCFSQMAWADTADDILTEVGIHGGIIVHLGCGNGELTSALCRSGEYLVHGLDRDAANVESARKRFVGKGQHWKATVECWAQRTLPFIDNLVNLVVVEDAGDISMAEIRLLLCPNGVIMTKDGDGWKKTVKPKQLTVCCSTWIYWLPTGR